MSSNLKTLKGSKDHLELRYNNRVVVVELILKEMERISSRKSKIKKEWESSGVE